MKGLTKKQQDLLAFIETTLKEKDHAPSFREIGVFMGVTSTNCVSQHVHALEKKGFISVTPYAPRGIRIVCEASNDVANAEN